MSQSKHEHQIIRQTHSIILASIAAASLALGAASLVVGLKLANKVDRLEQVVDQINIDLSKVQPWAKSNSEMIRMVKENLPEVQQDATSTRKAPAPALSGDRRYGDVNAQFTLIEFSDFECPFCKDFSPIPKQLVNGSKGNISLVFKHVPVHGEAARREALAAECAAAQGGNDAFFRMSDAIFDSTESNGQGTQKPLATLANSIGLDGRELTRCIDDGDHLEKIRADFKEAIDSGLKQTPTIVIKHNPTGKKMILEGAHSPEDILRAMGNMVNGQGTQQ